jgi:hypothetical protein
VKDTLRTAVVARLIPTSRTRLRGVPWVNALNVNAAFLCLVVGKRKQLRERPTMELALGPDVLIRFPTSHLRGLADIREVLKDDGRTSRDTVHDAFGKHMVTIPVEPSLLSPQFLEVAFGAFASVGLQRTLQAKETTVAFLPLCVAKKVPCGSDRRAIESQVDTHHRLVLLNSWFGDIDHDMQPPASVAETQISRGSGVADVLLAEAWNPKPDRHLARAGRKADGLVGPIERVGMHIVANRALFRLRAPDGFKDRNLPTHLLRFGDAFGVGRFLFGLPGKGTFEGFGGFDAGLNEQIRDQPGTAGLGVIIGGVMQAHAVLLVCVPPVGTHQIVGIGELLQCRVQCIALLTRGLKFELYDSVHNENHTIYGTFCQQRGVHPERSA